MYSEEEFPFDIEDEELEINEYMEDYMEKLMCKSVSLELGDEEGKLWCPTCCASKRKQSYKYSDLLQHAEAIGAGGNRGPEAAGIHRAMAKYLKTELEKLAPIRPENYLGEADRPHDEELLACPWTVVICNISNQFLQCSPENSKRTGLTKYDISKYFTLYNPKKVHVFYGTDGHLGFGVLQFNRDLQGLNDALALEKYFLNESHGWKDFERLNAHPDSLGTAIYGWVATEVDRRKPRFGFQEIAKYLNASCDMKKIGEVEEEFTRMYDLRLRKLGETLAERKQEIQDLKNEILTLQNKDGANRMVLTELTELQRPGSWLRCNIL